jgi:glutaredoxin
MKPLVLAAACLAAAIVCSTSAEAQTTLYRWVDKDGKVHFSDTPPADTSQVTQKRLGGDVPQDLPFASREAARRHPVTLYPARGCGEPCQQARDLLARRGIPYAERDPMVSTRDAESLTKLVGAMEVPVLVVGEGNVKGFEEGQWHAALDGAGYPRSLPPGMRAPTPQPPVPDPAVAAPPPQEPAKQ